MHTSGLLIFTSLLVGAFAPPPAHFLNWVCDGKDSDHIPDVCNNMCFGANCKGLPTKLYYDKQSDSVKASRRRTAGCNTKLKCGSGEECDEYPFASTSNSPATDPVLRCVPAEQNHLQGSALSQFYQSHGSFDDVGLGGNPGTFNVGFANAGGIPYCGSTCKPDGKQYNKHGQIKRRSNDRRSEFETRNAVTLYKLDNGNTFYAPSGAEPGDIVWTPLSHNKTLHAEMVNNHVFNPDQGLEQYDYMQHNMYTERATVVGPAN